MTEAVERKASEMGLTSLVICAKMEEEIVNMDEHSRDGLSNERLLEELAGIKESGISRIIKACKILLNLNSFYTAGPIESRSWSISRGTKAREAASLIHTDIAKGFIKAEVISFNELIALEKDRMSINSSRDLFAIAKLGGKLRIEGPSYEMADGDVVLFRFK